MTDPIALQAENERLEQELAAAQARVRELETCDTMIPPQEADTSRSQLDAALVRSYLIVEDVARHLKGVIDGNKIDCAQFESETRRDIQRLTDRLNTLEPRIDTLNANISLLVDFLRKQQTRDAVMTPKLELVKDAE